MIDEGHFGLPSFRYLSITAFMPKKIDKLGIYYARSEMLALANLLEHPSIKPKRMSGLIEGMSIKRSNKDLGRVLAIAYLAEVSGVSDFEPWGYEWQFALNSCFPKDWKQLTKNAGLGLESLLKSEEDLIEAYYSCIYGLLSSTDVQIDQLKTVGKRLLGEAVETLNDLSER